MAVFKTVNFHNCLNQVFNRWTYVTRVYVATIVVLIMLTRFIISYNLSTVQNTSCSNYFIVFYINILGHKVVDKIQWRETVREYKHPTW